MVKNKQHSNTGISKMKTITLKKATPQEIIKRISAEERTNNIRLLVKKNLLSFLVGDDYGLAYQEPIKTNPGMVFFYLHVFISEGLITNEQINEALSHIDVSVQENVWLIMLYIEAQVSHQNDDYYHVKIDVPMLVRMLDEKADSALKNTYTVNYIRNETKEKYGYEIKFEGRTNIESAHFYKGITSCNGISGITLNVIEICDSGCYSVLINGRILLYLAKSNTLRGFVQELESIGFEDKGGWYERLCNPFEIEAAYQLVGTYTSYKGFNAKIDKGWDIYGKSTLRLEFDPNDEKAIESIQPRLGYKELITKKIWYFLDLRDQEISDVWQIRKPVEGFPMLGEEKVYVKKDGVWLPRKEYGSRIDE